MSCTAAEPFLRAEGTKLFWGDKEYRAIGVNQPHISRIYTGQMGKDPEQLAQDRASVLATIQDASQHKVAFLRFFAYPNSPSEIAWYQAHKDEYWKAMDNFVALCHQYNLKLLPSLGMNPWLNYPPYTGEHDPAILDPDSRTHRLIYDYVHDMVTRYKEDPDILMWEITNEGFLHADVAPGKDSRDIMTFSQWQQFYHEASIYIKSLDSNHLLTSGDACVRPESMSRRFGNKLQMDSLRDNLSNLIASQPIPIDVLGLHCYGPFGPSPKARYKQTDAQGYELFPGGLRVDDYIDSQVQALYACRAPILIGELGQQYPFLNEDASAKWLLSEIDRLEAENVSLICLWVWHFPEQPEFTFDSVSHPNLVKRVQLFNEKYAASPQAHTTTDASSTPAP